MTLYIWKLIYSYDKVLQNMARIHIVGNSISYGFSEDASDWSSRLKAETNRRREIKGQSRITVVNLSSPGNMLTHYLDSGVFAASINCNPRGRQLGVICAGVCESCILHSRGETTARRSKHDFAQDLARLSLVANDLNRQRPTEGQVSLSLMGPTPVDDRRAFRTLEGDEFNDKRLREYDDVQANYASEHGITYVGMRFGFDRETMLADDGVHLNYNGNEFVYKRMFKAILRQLNIEDES